MSCRDVRQVEDLRKQYAALIRLQGSQRAREVALEIFSHPAIDLSVGSAEIRSGIVQIQALAAKSLYPTPPHFDDAAEQRNRSAMLRMTSALDATGCLDRRREAGTETPSALNSGQKGPTHTQSTSRDGVPEVTSANRKTSFAPIVIVQSAVPILVMLLVIGLGIYIVRRVQIRIDARQSKRYAFSAAVRVRFKKGGTVWSCQSEDINLGGMKIRAPEEAAPLEKVVLSLGGKEIQATVRWSNQYYFGVIFQRALSKRQLDRLVTRSKRSEGKKEKAAPA